MSQENVEIVRRHRGRMRPSRTPIEIYDLLDPEIEWDASRRTFDPGVFHGYDGIKEFAARLRDVWESGRIEPLEFIPTGGEVVVPVRLAFVCNSRTAKCSPRTRLHVWTLRDGRVIRHCTFQTKAEALEAAGLGEAA